jgi:hypothetical protein
VKLAQIEAKQMQVNIVYDTAKKIRVLLNEARESYGAEQWDDDVKQDEVLELVTEETDE